VNSYNLTFDSNKVRNYSTANGLQYNVDDVLFVGGVYWKVTEAFTATTAITLTDVAVQVYWKELRAGYVTGDFHEFADLTRNRLYQDIDDSYAFSVLRNKIYSPKRPKRVSLTYVPEHTDVFDFDTEVNYPNYILDEWKKKALVTLSLKLGGARNEQNS
jgi:hypothetical protein